MKLIVIIESIKNIYILNFKEFLSTSSCLEFCCTLYNKFLLEEYFMFNIFSSLHHINGELAERYF